jgi:hypothetical protein
MNEVKKEQPEIRDSIAMHIAAALIEKSDIKVISDDLLMRKIVYHIKRQIEAIALLSYAIADAMVSERAKRD